jgi:serine protease Do
VLDVNTGRVVAVVNMVLVKAGRESALSNPTGISYAIPVRYVQELIKSLR